MKRPITINDGYEIALIKRYRLNNTNKMGYREIIYLSKTFVI